jgi:hypothetical protein
MTDKAQAYGEQRKQSVEEASWSQFVCSVGANILTATDAILLFNLTSMMQNV